MGILKKLAGIPRRAVNTEPVAVAAAVEGLFAVLVIFGIDVGPDVAAVTITAVGAILTLLARDKVTPV